MEEIKFRAWSNYEEKYYYNIGLMNGNIYADLGDNYGDENWQIIGHTDDSDFIIEQFTGIKDFWGFEIYEGHILKNEEGNVVFCKKVINDRGIHFDFMDYCRPACMYCSITEQFKTIGDIHQSKQILLNEKEKVNQYIDVLGLSNYTKKILERSGIMKISELLEFKRYKMHRTKGFGEKTKSEIKEKLNVYLFGEKNEKIIY